MIYYIQRQMSLEVFLLTSHLKIDLQNVPKDKEGVSI